MLSQLPEELNVFKITAKEDDRVVGLFGEINPLSNFFPSSFLFDGTHYISSEQFIQSQKAKYFGDAETQNLILGSTSSLECKDLSRQIRAFDEKKWATVACSICHPGIRAKFQQNQYAMDTLVYRTRGKRIVECASDPLWGNGKSLNEPDCLDGMKWTSQGILGEILESIRDEYVSSNNIPTLRYQDSLAQLTGDTLTDMRGILRPPISEPQPIPGSHTTNPAADVVGSLNEPASSSISTTPVSDTTASDTDGDANLQRTENSAPTQNTENNSEPMESHQTNDSF